jgi:hypothetical protein
MFSAIIEATTNDKSTTFPGILAEFGAHVAVACPPGEEHAIAALAVPTGQTGSQWTSRHLHHCYCY